MAIDDLRKEIDSIDNQLLELLDRRAEIAKKIGHEKQIISVKSPGFFDPERENRNVLRLEAQPLSIFPKTSIRPVFKEIMSACRSLETEMVIAFLGPEGTFSHLAATRIFGQSVQYLEAIAIQKVFEAVERRQAAFGVVPLENSNTGGIPETFTALLESSLKIRGELTLTISHCLASKAGSHENITKIYSHPQALAQCRRWLADNIPQAVLVETTSTSKAAQLAALEPQAGAICSKNSAEFADLPVLRAGIEDQIQNETRFIILAETEGPPTGQDRTTVAFTASPRSTAKLLSQIEAVGFPVIRFETRPDPRKKWQSLCFVDFQGHHSEARATAILEQIRNSCDFMKTLGSYSTSLK